MSDAEGKTFTARFDEAEQAALAVLPPDLQAVGRSDPARFRASEVAARADWLKTGEAEDRLKELRGRAAMARERSRISHPGAGRPPKPPEQTELEDYEQQRRDSGDDAAQALKTYLRQVERLAQAVPALDCLENLATDQRLKVEAALTALDEAATAYGEAVELTNTGKAIMREHADLVTFTASPFVDLQQPVNFLSALLRTLKLRYDAESARVGADPSEQEAEAARRAEAAQYRKDLQAATAAYRKTEPGKAAWTRYVTSLRALEAAQLANPETDLTGGRQGVQSILDQYHTAACEQVGMIPNTDLFPKLG
jgi:hypothetical protein